MWFSLWASLASGQDCPDLAERMTSARALFDDAELQAAKSVVAEAMSSLDCQGRVLTTDQLMELYHLDTLVSITLSDRKGATYSTLRAVAADHTAQPPAASYGPLLVDLWATWTERLSSDLIPIRVQGNGLVWVDGRQIDHNQILYATGGEHLIQVRANGTLRSELVELTEGHVVITGEPGPGPKPFPPEEEASTDVPPVAGLSESATPPVSSEVPVAESGRRRPWGYFIGGALMGLAGGGAMYWASTEEERFLSDPYTSGTYGDCSQDQACWTEARDEEISRDALMINLGYGAGYSMLAGSTTLFGVGVVGVGRSTSVHFNFRF